MKRRIIVVGLPGVGKSTVLAEFLKLAEKEGVPVQLVNYGSVMMDAAKGLVKDRDEMRKASTELQRKIQKKAAEMIVERSGEGVTVVDTHAIIKTPSGYLPGLPNHVLSILDPNLIALVETTPDEIASRRQTDKSRKRDDVLLREVETEILLSRAMAAAYATLVGAPLKLVQNPAGGQAEAGRSLYSAVVGE